MKHVASELPGPYIPAAPPGAAGVFGSRLPLAVRFTEILADTGVSHGLIGPREVPRLWDRHVLNCAVVHDAFPVAARLVDVGSGAGLPGVALAIARADLDVHLVEPMLRRTQWLSMVVDELGLDNVTVHRGRAEDLVGVVSAPWVTARAVARLDKLAHWCVPLLDDDGTLVAMKGRSAAEELAEDRRALERLGLVSAAVTAHGGDVLEEPVLTVDLRFRPRPAAQRASRTRRRGAGAGTGRKVAGGGRAGRGRRPDSGRGSSDAGSSGGTSGSGDTGGSPSS